MSVLVGIDAGASHTEAVSGGRDGGLLGRARGRSGAIRPGQEREAVRHWMEALRETLPRDGETRTPAAVVVGAAGAGDPAASARAQEMLAAALGPGSLVCVVTDGEIALEAAFPGGAPGIVVTAGSGSNAFARDGDGALHRVGGVGWQFGDEGSGYALARDALAAVGRALEGRGPETSLGERLAAALPCERAVELVPWARDAAPREVAVLARTVADAAAHDRVAAVLVERAAEDLAAHVEALLSRFPDAQPVPVAFNGGLLHPDSAVRHALLRVLHERHGRLALELDPVDPPLGALRLARRLR